MWQDPNINQDGLLTDTDAQPQQQPMPVPQMPLPQPQFGVPQNAGMQLGEQPAPKPPKVPQDPNTRMDLWRNLLGDFMWSLASGAEAGSKARPGARKLAVFGGAMQGPYYREKAKQDLAFSQAKQAATEAAAKAAMDRVGVSEMMAQVAQSKQAFVEQAASQKDAQWQAKFDEMKRQFDEMAGPKKRVLEATAAVQENAVANPNPVLMPQGTIPPAEGSTPPGARPIYQTPAADTNPLVAHKVMLDGKEAEVLLDKKGNYFNADKTPVVGRITPYHAPPTPRAAGEITPNAEAGLISNLHSQWDKASKDVQSLYRANTIMSAGMEAAKRGDMNAGSQAVLVTFQKFLDPTSVVRESEYARSAEGLAIAERVRGFIGRLEEGGAGVTLQELQTFANLATQINQRLSGEGTGLLSAERARIAATADRFKIPVNLVIPDYDYSKPGGPGPRGAAAPAAGGAATDTTHAYIQQNGKFVKNPNYKAR